MYPILKDFGTWNIPFLGEIPLFLPTYGFILAFAAFTVLFIWIKVAKKEGFKTLQMTDLGFYALLAGILGSKVALLITDFKYYWQNPAEILYIYRAAGVYQGGIIAALAVIILFALKHRLPIWKLADTAALPVPLGQAIGRIGCFFAGCCYGKPAASLPWSITFTSPVAYQNTGVPLGIPLHPTQIYQSLNDFILFLILLILWRFKKFNGQILWMYILLYSITRGIIEFFRGDLSRGVYFGGWLSTSQILGMVGAFISIIMLIFLYRKSLSKT
jgi:phosphatidylglycerol:prolipoprotein diacylglycerol transferase